MSSGLRRFVLTGRTPAGSRQALVDRFQQDDEMRVFLANIVAGGVGLNLTAATQVVFNDLDWVPANHWQAEDRAYRIGQTRTVNVTYVVGRGTLDDFVQAVLEAKAALVTRDRRGRGHRGRPVWQRPGRTAARAPCHLAGSRRYVRADRRRAAHRPTAASGLPTRFAARTASARRRHEPPSRRGRCRGACGEPSQGLLKVLAGTASRRYPHREHLASRPRL